MKKKMPTELCDKMNRAWNKSKVSNFLPKKVEEIITAKYEDIAKYQGEFRNRISRLPSKSEKESILKEIKEIFNYSNKKENNENDEKIGRFDSKIRNFFIRYSSELNISTCHYCDTAYTGTFDESGGTERGQFELDHFFSKDKYPFLALSLYNFVPSCRWCNSYKSDEDWEIDKKSKEISPTSNEYNFDDNVKIRVEPGLNDSNEELIYYGDNFTKNHNLYKIVFDINEKSGYDTLIKNLHLEERYNMASIKSVALSLLDLKKKYPPQHINEISEIFIKNNIHISEDEIREFIFNGNQDKKYSLLNKLRRDILDCEFGSFDSKDI